MDWIAKHSIEIISFLIILITALGGFGVFLWKLFSWQITKILNPIKEIQDRQLFFENRVKEFGVMLEDISKIVGYELRNNGGGSNKDKIDKIYEIIKELLNRDNIHFILDSQPKAEIDSNGNCIRVNKKWQELTGLSENQSLGKEWIGNCVDASDQLRVSNSFGDFISNNLEFHERYSIINKQDKLLHRVLGMTASKKDVNSNIQISILTFEVVETIKLNEKLTRLYKTA